MTFIHYTAPWFLYHPKQDRKYSLQFVLLKASEKCQYRLFVVSTSEKCPQKPQMSAKRNRTSKNNFYSKLTTEVPHFESFDITTSVSMQPCCCDATVSAESVAQMRDLRYFSFSGYCDFDSVVRRQRERVAGNGIH